MEVSIRVKRLLFEAYRRNDIADEHERSKPLKDRWLGLGTASAYRPVLDAGLMIWHDGRTPPPRCMGWLVLTKAGLKVFESLEPQFAEILANLKKTTSYKESYRSAFSLAGGLTAS